MKKTIKTLAVLMAVCLTIGLLACSSYGKIEKALTDREYKVVQDDAVAGAIEKENSKENNGLEIHCFYNSKKITTVYVLEVKSTSDIQKLIKDSTTIKSLVNDIKENGTAEEIFSALKERGLVNDNCLVIAVGVDASNVYDLVKGL